MDRLVGNQRLYCELALFYRAMSHWLLNSISRPRVLSDWSDSSKDRHQQLLRAAIPVGIGSITLYEELHPIERLGNREVQHRVLTTLQRMLPSQCQPFIIADSGFRVPFFNYVESLGWRRWGVFGVATCWRGRRTIPSGSPPSRSIDRRPADPTDWGGLTGCAPIP